MPGARTSTRRPRRRYDAKEDARAAEEVALLAVAGHPGRRIARVELGAGTGQFTLAARRVCRRVVAVDVSPVMLARLRREARRRRLNNVDVVQAGFLTYEHAGAPADFVYSRYALHHLPDFWKAVALAGCAGCCAAAASCACGTSSTPSSPTTPRRGSRRGRATGAADVESELDPGRARGARPRRALDLHLAPRADDPAERLRVVEAEHSDSVFARYVCRKR